MTSDLDTARIVRSWLDEGVTQLPDRVLDAVLDQLPATHQRRVTWWPTGWPPTTKSVIATALAVAANPSPARTTATRCPSARTRSINAASVPATRWRGVAAWRGPGRARHPGPGPGAA